MSSFAVLRKLQPFGDLKANSLTCRTSRLRIGMAKGGCSGLQYEMTLGAARPGDAVIERDGVKFFVDEESAQLLRGSTLDYRDALTGAGFQIVNPNAARTCGCGSSFEPARPL